MRPTDFSISAGGPLLHVVRRWVRAGSVLALHAVGSPVHVLYFRDRPGRSALYPPIRWR